jgi:hypothetical protein
VSEKEKYLATFTVPVTIHLNQAQSREANRAINTHFIGSPQLKRLSDKVSPEHMDASHNVHSYYIVDVEVGLLKSGKLELIREVPPPGIEPGSQASET